MEHYGHGEVLLMVNSVVLIIMLEVIFLEYHHQFKYLELLGSM